MRWSGAAAHESTQPHTSSPATAITFVHFELLPELLRVRRGTLTDSSKGARFHDDVSLRPATVGLRGKWAADFISSNGWADERHDAPLYAQ